MVEILRDLSLLLATFYAPMAFFAKSRSVADAMLKIGFDIKSEMARGITSFLCASLLVAILDRKEIGTLFSVGYVSKVSIVDRT